LENKNNLTNTEIVSNIQSGNYKNNDKIERQIENKLIIAVIPKIRIKAKRKMYFIFIFWVMNVLIIT